MLCWSSLYGPLTGAFAIAAWHFAMQQRLDLIKPILKRCGYTRNRALEQRLSLLEPSLERLHERTWCHGEHSASDTAQKLPQHYIWHAPVVCLNIGIIFCGLAVYTNMLPHELDADGYPPLASALTDYAWQTFICSAFCLVVWALWHHDMAKIERDLVTAAV